MNLRNMLAGLALTLAPLGAVACASNGTSTGDGRGTEGTQNEDVGTVTAALTAIGSDGATYSLNPSAELVLTLAGDAGLPINTVTFDSTTPTQTFSLPVGSYTATLLNGAPLTRVADGGSSSVPATLTDAQPYAFTVKAGATTALTFHFQTHAVGNITFSTGTLSTSLSLEAGAPTSPGHGTFSGITDLNGRNLVGPSGLNTALGNNASVVISYLVSVSLTGPFAPSADSACAPVSGTISVLSGPDGGTGGNVEAFFTEASGGTGYVCLDDANAGGDVFVELIRTGAPQTSQMKSALGADAGTSEFVSYVDGLPAAPLYNGTTAAISQLSQPLTVPAAVVALYNNTNTQVFTDTGGAVTSTVTIQLTP